MHQAMQYTCLASWPLQCFSAKISGDLDVCLCRSSDSLPAGDWLVVLWGQHLVTSKGFLGQKPLVEERDIYLGLRCDLIGPWSMFRNLCMP